MMSAQRGFEKYRHFIYLVFLFLFLIIWFAHLKETIVPRHIMYSRVDDLIPFVKEFVIAYYFWFAYMAIGFIYLGLASNPDFYRMELFLALGMSISFIIFILYPNAQFPRPSVPGNDVFSMLVNFIYTHDGTNNVFPSIHVCNSIGVHLALVNSSKLEGQNCYKMFVFCNGICHMCFNCFHKAAFDNRCGRRGNPCIPCLFGYLQAAKIVYRSRRSRQHN